MRAAITLILLVVIPTAMALSVQKSVESPGSLETGKDLKVLLSFNNPYGQELPIKIQSRDVAGGAGYDIQCYEFTLPKDPQTTLQLSLFQPYFGGDFTLGKATITYTNPITGKEETAVSNELNITVKGEGEQTESVTTVYQCDGKSMQSTQTRSTSQSQQNQQQQNQQQQSQQEQSQQQMDQKLQQNQMNQDSQQLKQQLQEEMAQHQQAEEEFEKALQQNQELKDMQQQLQDQGYEQTGKDLNPRDNNSGQFEYEYHNDEGQQAKISGEMQDGDMEELSSTRDLDEQELQELLQNDSKYQELSQSLEQKGFNQTEFSYAEKDGQASTSTTFENEIGEQLNITAKVQNETVTDVELEDGKKKSYWWLAIALAAIAGTLIFLFRKKPELVAEIQEPPFDYIAHAQGMLEEAQRLFAQKQYKDAYGRASEALRLYYSHKHGTGRELTATEAVKLLRSKEVPYDNARLALNLCGMVEFAKYRPNQKDFSAIINKARKEIV